MWLRWDKPENEDQRRLRLWTTYEDGCESFACRWSRNVMMARLHEAEMEAMGAQTGLTLLELMLAFKRLILNNSRIIDIWQICLLAWLVGWTISSCNDEE